MRCFFVYFTQDATDNIYTPQLFGIDEGDKKTASAMH